MDRWRLGGGPRVGVGSPETITVTDQVVSLVRGRGRLGRTEHLSAPDIRNVRLLPVPLVQRAAALLGFWGTGWGRVAIDLPGMTHRCGTALSALDARLVVEALRQGLKLRAAPDEPQPYEITPGFVRSRRVLGWAGTAVTLYMSGEAVYHGGLLMTRPSWIAILATVVLSSLADAAQDEYCRVARIGALLYSGRLGALGNFYASLVAADHKVFMASEEGVVVVLDAGEQ